MTAQADDTPQPVTRRELLLVSALAVALTMAFWWPLWNGGGLVGGDIYSYFFPQKQFLADSLQNGEFPLWNNRTSFGYPLIAESQTGALYPPHLLMYGLLDVNTAYNANQILHYVLAFVFTWLLARRLGLAVWGSALAAIVYVYGWFPPRMCLEWAIIGGAWLPLALLLLEMFLRSRLWLWLAGLAIVLAVQMLAGHYNLAFITQLLLVVWVPLRLFFWTDHVDASLLNRRGLTCGHVLASLGLGFGLAAVQLAPTLELKQLSQREAPDGKEFDPGHGHIPPLYLSQVVASWWYWYDIDINRNEALTRLKALAISSGTNETEAHLYFGLASVALIAWVLLHRNLHTSLCNRQTVAWLIIAAGAILYAIGWLVPVAQHLPGFGFFRGPGRYGILATLAVAIIAGQTFDTLMNQRRQWKLTLLGFLILGLTVADLLIVARQLQVAVMVREPPINALGEAPSSYSPLQRLLYRQSSLVRLFAPGPNLPNLFRVSTVPEYLGIGPAQYYQESLRAPDLATETNEFLEWADAAAISHVLSFAPLFRDDGAELSGLVYSSGDYFLNRAWGRHPLEPLYVYQLHSGRNPRRVRFVERQHGQKIIVVDYKANSVSILAETPKPATLVLADLDYPGWTVTVDGEPVESQTWAGQFRSVAVPAGQHRIQWSFRPKSFRNGAAISFVSLLVVASIALMTLRKNASSE